MDDTPHNVGSLVNVGQKQRQEQYCKRYPSHELICDDAAMVVLMYFISYPPCASDREPR